MKPIEQTEARRLRKEEGCSVREIQRRLRVSRSSVSRWVKDIELTPDQLADLAARNPILNAQMNGARARADRARAVRRLAQAEGRAAARAGDPFHAAACMLYWGEGSKTRNVVELTNSDPMVVTFFLRFLRWFFEVPDIRVRIQCNVHAADVDRVVEIEDYRLDALALSRESLTKSMVNSVPRSSLQKRRNLLPQGTCRLTVCDTAVVQHIYGAIQEYGGFDRPGWLD